MRKYKTLNKKRVWLDDDSSFGIVEVSSYPGFGSNETTTYIDASIRVSSGGDVAYLPFDHQRGDYKSIRKARNTLEKLRSLVEIIDSHITDAELMREGDAEYTKAAKVTEEVW